MLIIEGEREVNFVLFLDGFTVGTGFEVGRRNVGGDDSSEGVLNVGCALVWARFGIGDNCVGECDGVVGIADVGVPALEGDKVG